MTRERELYEFGERILAEGRALSLAYATWPRTSESKVALDRLYAEYQANLEAYRAGRVREEAR